MKNNKYETTHTAPTDRGRGTSCEVCTKTEAEHVRCGCSQQSTVTHCITHTCADQSASGPAQTLTQAPPRLLTTDACHDQVLTYDFMRFKYEGYDRKYNSFEHKPKRYECKYEYKVQLQVAEGALRHASQPPHMRFPPRTPTIPHTAPCLEMQCVAAAARYTMAAHDPPAPASVIAWPQS